MKNFLHFLFDGASAEAIRRFKASALLKAMLLVPLFLLSLQSYGQLTLDWAKQYSPSDSFFLGDRELTTDAANNLIVAGTTQGEGTFNIAVVKWSPDGNVLWRYDLPKNDQYSSASLIEMKTDASGNSYVLGYAEAVQGAGSVVVAKINSAGQQVWVAYEAGGQGANIPQTMTLDTAGNVYFIGEFSYSTDEAQLVLVKLNTTDGSTAWVAKDSMGFTAYSDVAVGADGSIYVVGDKVEQNIPTTALVKYDSAGAALFYKAYAQYIYNSASNYIFALNDFLYLASETTIGSKKEFVALKLDESGQVLWNKSVPSGESLYSFLGDVEVDQEDNLLLTGSYATSRPYTDILTAKVAPSGEVMWTDLYAYMDYGLNQPSDLAINQLGQIAITGFTLKNPNTFDFSGGLITILYSPEGEVLDTEPYQHDENVSTRGQNVAFDAQNNLYVTGRASMAEGNNFILLKYKADNECAVPVAVKMYLPPTPVKVGSQLRTTAVLGDYILQGEEGIRWNWGDGSSSMAYTAFGTPRITGEHTYAEAGIYKISLDFSASCLTPASEDYVQWKAVYNPLAGTVSGAGWLGDEARPVSLGQLTDRTLFAFSVRYRNANATKPTGVTALTMSNRAVFLSTSLDWLVVRKNMAVWEGVGTINGRGKYKFVASAQDGGGNGQNDSSDKLRIKVWNQQNGEVIFDNFPEGGEIYNMAQTLPGIGGGQIITNSRHLLAGPELVQRSVELKPGKELIAYPNPFNTTAKVSFTLEQEGSYSLMLYDIKGSMVRELKQGNAAVGEPISTELNSEGLARGVYFVRLQTAGEVQTVKVVLSR